MIITVASCDRVPGIYAILNTANGKRYVGSAVSLRTRLRNHLWHLRQGSHRNRKLLNAWRKHGEESFQAEILETVFDAEMLILREQYWIDAHNAHAGGYNLNPTAGSNLGRKSTPCERSAKANATRKAWAEPGVKERHRECVRAAMNRPETLLKMRDHALRRYADPQAKAFLTAAQNTAAALGKRSASARTARLKIPAETRSAMARDAAMKTYRLQWPDGKVEVIVGLKAFCDKNSLSYNSAISVVLGRMKTLKGIRIEKGFRC